MLIALVCELCSSTLRGRRLVLLVIVMQFGNVVVTCLVDYVVTHLGQHTYKKIVLSVSGLPFLGLVALLCLSKESPRLLLAHRKYEEAFLLIDQGIRLNQG